jgi:hypothetical protein
MSEIVSVGTPNGTTDFTGDQERLADPRRRGARRMGQPKFVSLAAGVVLSLAEQVRENEMLTDTEKLEMFQALPRNRREARRYLRGNGPWGIAKKR